MSSFPRTFLGPGSPCLLTPKSVRRGGEIIFKPRSGEYQYDRTCRTKRSENFDTGSTVNSFTTSTIKDRNAEVKFNVIVGGNCSSPSDFFDDVERDSDTTGYFCYNINNAYLLENKMELRKCESPIATLLDTFYNGETGSIIISRTLLNCIPIHCIFRTNMS